MSPDSPTRTDSGTGRTDKEFEVYLDVLGDAEKRRSDRRIGAMGRKLQRNCDEWSEYFHILRGQFGETWNLFGTIQDKVGGWLRSEQPTEMYRGLVQPQPSIEGFEGMSVCDGGYYFRAELVYANVEHRDELRKRGTLEHEKSLLVSFGWYPDSLSKSDHQLFVAGRLKTRGKDGIGDESKLPFQYLRDRNYFLARHYNISNDPDTFRQFFVDPERLEELDVVLERAVREVDEDRLSDISYRDQLTASQHNFDLLRRHKLAFHIYNNRMGLSQTASIGVDVLSQHSLKQACQRLFAALNQDESIDLSRYLPQHDATH